MERITRRRFLSKSGKGFAGTVLGGMAATAKSSSRVHGANEKVRIALIGCGSRGRSVARGLVQQGAEVPYICEVNRTRVAPAQKEFEKLAKRYLL